MYESMHYHIEEKDFHLISATTQQYLLWKEENHMVILYVCNGVVARPAKWLVSESVDSKLSVFFPMLQETA